VAPPFGVGGLRALARDIGRAARRRLPRGVILMYHRIAGPRFDPQSLDVSAEHFAAHLDLLAQRATVIPLDEFNMQRRRGTLPRRAVAITFDDGYADNLLTAVPLLAARGLSATVFVATGMLDANREFWWDDAERIAFSTRHLPPPVPSLPIAWDDADGLPIVADAAHAAWTVLSSHDPTSRHRLYRALCAALYPLNAESRERLLAALRAWAGIEAGARASHRTVTSDELRQLAAAPGISIGAHSVTHSSLARLTDDEQYRELEDSRATLVQSIERPISSVAYPYGQPDDVSAVTTRAASFAGFDYAVTVSQQAAWMLSPEFRLPRCIVRNWNGPSFARELDGWFTS
jgi:peptidoglycan/xylan/chitin deacetylase (PgdA/CDA1 family)